MVEYLFEIHSLIIQAKSFGITKILAKKQHILVDFDAKRLKRPEKILTAIKAEPTRYKLGGTQSVLVQKTETEEELKVLQNALSHFLR